MKHLRRKLRELLLSNVTPKEVSSSFALGMFISLTPTLGLHTALAMGFAFLLKKNKIATLMGAHFTNPLIVLPVFYFNFRLGQWMIGDTNHIAFSHELLLHPSQLGSKILVPLWVGSLAMAILGSITSYYLILFLYRWFAPKIEEFRKRHHHAS